MSLLHCLATDVGANDANQLPGGRSELTISHQLLPLQQSISSFLMLLRVFIASEIFYVDLSR